VVTDLFVDLHKFRGDDVRHQIPQLQRLVMDYDKEGLLNFFGPLSVVSPK
jgi:hypothetical protein